MENLFRFINEALYYALDMCLVFLGQEVRAADQDDNFVIWEDKIQTVLSFCLY